MPEAQPRGTGGGEGISPLSTAGRKDISMAKSMAERPNIKSLLFTIPKFGLKDKYDIGLTGINHNMNFFAYETYI